MSISPPDRRQFLLAATSLAVSLAAGGPAWAQGADRTADYDALLAKYLNSPPDGVNRVDYTRWHASRADRAGLDGYVAWLVTLRPSAMPREAAFAYWGNLYNAVTLKVVLDGYPVASIKDIKSSGSWFDFKGWLGPWRTKLVKVEGRDLSLDDIEHEIMRPTFKDPRVHYVVNCASFGCPNLKPTAWRAETLEADLEAAARAFVNHPRGVLVKPDGTLRVSSIYKWFIADFGGTDAGVIEHLRKYAVPALAEKLAGNPKIAEDDYDWRLNAPQTAA